MYLTTKQKHIGEKKEGAELTREVRSLYSFGISANT